MEIFFALFLCSLGQPSHALVDYHLERGGILLHDAVEGNAKKDTTTEYQGAGA